MRMYLKEISDREFSHIVFFFIVERELAHVRKCLVQAGRSK